MPVWFVMPPIDLCAALFGAGCATFAFLRAPNGRDVTNVAVGFASGSSAFLLVIIAISVFRDPSLFETLLANNRVLLFGAIGYAAFINFRTIPGALTFLDGKKPDAAS
jgi:hypothetical protein